MRHAEQQLYMQVFKVWNAQRQRRLACHSEGSKRQMREAAQILKGLKRGQTDAQAEAQRLVGA
jgi:hypothetical protein